MYLGYSVVESDPGCLPESDPVVCESVADANRYLIDAIREYADEDDVAHDAALLDVPEDERSDDDRGRTSAYVESFITDEALEDATDPLSVTVVNNDDRHRVFEVVPFS